MDSVALGLLYRGLPPKEMLSRARAALEKLDMLSFSSTPGAVLSGGQRQRVAIGRAMASETPVLLADEPTGNLDSRMTDTVLDALDAIHASGTTVVLVTHSDVVSSRANRVVHLVDGRVDDTTTRSGLYVPDPTAPAETQSPGSPAAIGRGGRVHLASFARDVQSNVLSRFGRLAALVAAVAVTVALLVTTIGLSYSASRQVSSAFDVATSREVTATQRVDQFTPPLSDAALERIRALNGVTAVADVVNSEGAAQRRAGAESIRTPWFQVRGDVVRTGRLTVDWGATAWQGMLRPGTALVGEALATRLEIAAVDTSPTVYVNDIPYEVIGIVVDSPRQAGWIGGVLTAPTGQTPSTQVDNLTMVTTDRGAGQQVAGELPMAIDPYQPESVSITRPPDPTGMRQSVEATVSASLILLTTVTLVASILSLTLSSLSAAAERRVEFGLRRALGARGRHIIAMLTAEAAFVGLVGAMVGLLLGLGAILAVTIANSWVPVFDARLAVLAALAGIAVSILGAAAGAVRGVRVQPNTALKPSG